MKRLIMALCLGMAAIGTATQLPGQDAAQTAAAQADRQDMEERYKRLNSAVEEILVGEAQQRKRIGELVDEMRRLREDVNRTSQNLANCASVDDVKRLAKAVQEIEQKRGQDKELLQERFEELKKLYKNIPLNPEPRPPVNDSPPPEKTVEKPAVDMKGYEYQILSGDSLSMIVQAYRKQGVKVTMDQVIKANPGLNPNRLPAGKKIFIPDPSLK
jgi:hypothetical protein